MQLLSCLYATATFICTSAPVARCPYLFQRLSMHSRVNWASLKLVQVLAQQVQALIRWVIAIEPEASVTGVVVPAVEVLHQLVESGGRLNRRVPAISKLCQLSHLL